MKSSNFFLLALVIFSLVSPTTIVLAGDYGWMEDFNVKVQADPDGFTSRLAARFKVGAAEVEAVLRDVKNPADAYMIFRYGAMSSRPTNQVMERYRSEKKKGWGALAKSLGINPGSPEFKALKQNHDLDFGQKNLKKNNKGKGKDKNKGKS